MLVSRRCVFSQGFRLPERGREYRQPENAAPRSYGLLASRVLALRYYG